MKNDTLFNDLMTGLKEAIVWAKGGVKTKVTICKDGVLGERRDMTAEECAKAMKD